MRLILILFLIMLPTAAGGEYQTIDELVRATGDDSCKTCAAIYGSFGLRP